MPYTIYHPTTITVLEDEYDFAISLKDHFNVKAPFCLVDIIMAPNQAIEIFNNDTILHNFIQDLKRDLDNIDAPLLQEVSEVLPKHTLSHLENPYRFKMHSTLLVDYEMPAMKGIETIEKIHLPYIKKILLTGIADEDIAIKAFNQGLIQQYIRKQAPDFIEHTLQSVFELQSKFFKEIHTSFLDSLNLSKKLAFLDYKAFGNVFHSLFAQHNIIEYYLFSPSGSYIMLDADGNHYDLFVFSQEDLDEMIMYAEDVRASKDLLNDLKAYCKAVCFFNPENQTLTNDWTQWTPYIKPIQPIEGLEDYYYVCQPNLINILRESYVSFNQYKASLDK